MATVLTRSGAFETISAGGIAQFDSDAAWVQNDLVVYGDAIYSANTDKVVGGPTFAVAASGDNTWRPVGNAGLVSEYGGGSIAGQAVTSGTTADLATFTLPSAGVWNVSFSIRASVGAINSWGVITLADSSNNTIPGSDTITNFINPDSTTVPDLQGTSTRTVQVTTTGAATYKIRMKAVNAQVTVRADTVDGNGSSDYTWNKISGYLPAIGYEANSIFVRKDASQAMTNNTTVAWDSVLQQSSSGISYNSGTGEFTVNVAGTYDLFAEINWNPMTASWAEWRWEKNNTRIGRTTVSYRGAVAANESTGETNSCIVDCLVGDVLTLKVSATDGNNTQTIRGGFATAKIKQISKQLPVTTKFEDASNAYQMPDNNSSYSLAAGAQMTYLDGVWQPNVVEASLNAGVDFTNPWGEIAVYFAGSGNRNFQLKNVSGSTKFVFVRDWYKILTTNGMQQSYTWENTALANNGVTALWADNTINFVFAGSGEQAIIIVADSAADYEAGNYSEYEFRGVVGGGYNNNHFSLKRVR